MPSRRNRSRGGETVINRWKRIGYDPPNQEFIALLLVVFGDSEKSGFTAPSPLQLLGRTRAGLESPTTKRASNRFSIAQADEPARGL